MLKHFTIPYKEESATLVHEGGAVEISGNHRRSHGRSIYD